MKTTFTLSAEARNDVGKGASRRLRRAGKVPAIIYGTGKEPKTVCIDHTALLRALENESFYSRILTLATDGKEEKVVLKDLQRHPYKPRILHLDLLRISESEKLSMRIPLHFKGGDVAPGVKLGGGLVSHLINEVEIRCLPADLPEFIEVDLSKLELNQALHLSDLQLTKGVELVDLLHGENKTVVTVYIPRAVEEEVAPVVAAEGEAAAAEGAAAEGAEAKEGAAAGAEAKEKGKPASEKKGKEKD